MGDRPPDQQADQPADQPAGERDAGRPASEAEWERRRRLATVFGDVLPETTADERDPEVAPDDGAADRWLRSQVPPHHG